MRVLNMPKAYLHLRGGLALLQAHRAQHVLQDEGRRRTGRCRGVLAQHSHVEALVVFQVQAEERQRIGDSVLGKLREVIVRDHILLVEDVLRTVVMISFTLRPGLPRSSVI